jgi:hypothetical protein
VFGATGRRRAVRMEEVARPAWARGSPPSTPPPQPHLAQLSGLAERKGHDLWIDLAVRKVLAAAGMAPLPRDWPLDDLILAMTGGAGTALALAVLRGEQPIPGLR